MKPRRDAMSSRPMDRMVAKWFIYVVIGLAVAYLLMHFEEHSKRVQNVDRRLVVLN